MATRAPAKQSPPAATLTVSAASQSGAARWLPPILLILLTVAVFWPVCGYKFLLWDDYDNVAQNPIFPLTSESLLRIWYLPYLDLYMPVTYTVWGTLAQAARLGVPDHLGLRLDPHPFHALNLLVHLLSVLIVYRLLWVLCGRRWAAWFGAMLFAIHPVQVEPVAWVTGLKDVLSGFFAILALWQYVLFARPETNVEARSRRRYLHYSLATLAFALAILSKPSVVTLPLAAAAIDRFVLRRNWYSLVTDLTPWCLLSAGGALIAHFTQAPPPLDPGLWSRPLLAAYAIGAYLCKIVFPLRLMVAYRTPSEVLASPWLVWGAIAAAVAFLVIWILRRRAAWVPAAGLIFAAGLLPVLGLVPFDFERFSLTADRYLYLAMLGPSLALAFALSLRPASRVLPVVCVLGLSILTVRAGIRVTAWRDTGTLFGRELRENPYSYLAYQKLALVADQEGRADEAISLAEKSIALKPDQSAAYVTVGMILRARGQTDKSQAILEQACRAAPDSVVAMVDVAGLLIEKKDYSRAAELCRRVIALQPDAAPAHNQLATALAYQHDYAQALREAQTAVQLEPNTAQMHYTLALLLRDTHQPAAAEREFEEARRLSPQPGNGNLGP